MIHDEPIGLRIPYRTYMLCRLFYLFIVILLVICAFTETKFGIGFFFFCIIVYTIAEIFYIYSYDRKNMYLTPYLENIENQPTLHSDNEIKINTNPHMPPV